MTQQILLVDKEYLIEKFQGKGGWTFVRIPEIAPNKNSPFGWVKVQGTIDNFEIKNYNLQPMGNGTLFLPVKAEIRKKIRKKTGDYVHIILYPDIEPIEIPKELSLCLQDDTQALHFFNSLSQSEQYSYVKWIYSARTDQTKEDRIANALDRLAKRQKHYKKSAKPSH